MLQKSGDSLLGVLHLGLQSLLFSLILLSKLIDLLLLGVKHFELLFATHASVASILGLVGQLIVNFFDVTVVVVNHFAQIVRLLVLLFDLGIVLLDAVHETLSSFREWQVQFIGLEFKIFLALLQRCFLFAQMLGTLLKRVLLQTIFSGLETCSNFFELLALDTNFVSQTIVFVLEFLILIALLRVQVVQTGLVGKVDIIDLLLVRVELVLHVALLSKQGVQVRALLIVLVLDVHKQSLNVLRLGVTSVLV